jgi:hypothetical protein
MKSRHRPIITPEQQLILDEVELRLLTDREERARFDQMLIEGHYLHNVEIVGEQLRYVAEYRGQWVALMIWSAGAYKLKLREQWTGRRSGACPWSSTTAGSSSRRRITFPIWPAK